MDSGWAQFRAIYNFEARDEREITIQEGDIMIVAKPVMDETGWLTGENTRTREVGEFPGTYLEYIGDVESFLNQRNLQLLLHDLQGESQQGLTHLTVSIILVVVSI